MFSQPVKNLSNTNNGCLGDALRERKRIEGAVDKTVTLLRTKHQRNHYHQPSNNTSAYHFSPTLGECQ